MVEKIEDLNIPIANVARIIKDSLPSNASVSKEARQAIARAASVFIIFLTSTSTAIARNGNHKTISGQNILDALEQMEFEGFLDPLKEFMKINKEHMKEKKAAKINTLANNSATEPAAEEAIPEESNATAAE
ncbi:Chrac-14 family protein [Megaselia abdita]